MNIIVVNGCPDLVDHPTAQKWVDAIQRQVAIDFADVWQQSAVLHYAGDGIGSTPGPNDGIVRIVKSSSEPGTLGSHWFADGHPVGEVGIETCKQDGVSADLCTSHEILEMVLDPEGVRCFQLGSIILALEASDRVENTDSTYVIDGCAMENFSTPAAFLNRPSGPYDFRKILTTNTIAPTGYQLQVDVGSGQWTQTTGVLARHSKRRAAAASRRAGRMLRAGADASKLVVVVRA